MIDSVIQFRGTIYENGYGLLASKVMRDKSIPKQSRLIYAYMCSFAGMNENGERVAFPSVSLQCEELEMSEDTYYKWRKELEKRGLISIEKRKDKGKFERNLYYVEAIPVPKNDDGEPSPKNSGTEEKPYPKNSGTENSGTNNNSFNSNIINKKNNKDLLPIGNYQEKSNNTEIIDDKDQFKKTFTDICNTFYAAFASGRWTKKQWNALIDKFVLETIESDRYKNIPVGKMKGYAFKSIETMSYHADVKNKPI